MAKLKRKYSKNKPLTNSNESMELDLKRQGHKLRVELYKCKNKVEPDVWMEIKKKIKRLKSGIYLGQGTATINYEGFAENNIIEAKETVANRNKYAAYAKMKSDELTKAYCSKPKLRKEFDSKFQWFVSFIIKTFPDSPITFIIEQDYLRSISDEQIDRMIRDTPQEENGGEETTTTSEKMKLFEYIETTLVANLGIFKSKAFLDGLDYCKKDYDESHEKTNKEKRYYFPVHPLITPKNITYKTAQASILLATLHDKYLIGQVPVIPQSWPDDMKNLYLGLINGYETNRQNTIDSGIGLSYKNKIDQAIKCFETPTQDNQDKDASIDIINIEIDLSDFQDRNKGYAKQMLQDLVNYPKGFKYSETLHGKNQPKTLCQRLRKKPQRIYKNLAEHIHKRKEGNKIKIYLDENIEVTLKKYAT